MNVVSIFADQVAQAAIERGERLLQSAKPSQLFCLLRAALLMLFLLATVDGWLFWLHIGLLPTRNICTSPPGRLLAHFVKQRNRVPTDSWFPLCTTLNNIQL